MLLKFYARTYELCNNRSSPVNSARYRFHIMECVLDPLRGNLVTPITLVLLPSTTTAPVHTSCSLWDSQLCNINAYSPLLIAYIPCASAMKVIQKRLSFHLSNNLISPCSMTQACGVFSDRFWVSISECFGVYGGLYMATKVSRLIICLRQEGNGAIWLS